MMATKRMSIALMMVAMAMMMAFSAVAHKATDAATICNVDPSKLTVCRSAVSGKSPLPPTKDCCSLIRSADLKCLCGYKDLLPSLGINPALAFALPKKCRIPFGGCKA